MGNIFSSEKNFSKNLHSKNPCRMFVVLNRYNGYQTQVWGYNSLKNNDMKKVSKQVKKQINDTAKLCKAHGAKVEINHNLPYVSIVQVNGEEWFFQESEAEDLLNEVPDNVSPENYLLWVSTGW